MKFKSILLCLLLAISVNLFTTAKAQVNVNDSLALVDLYNSTNGDNWDHNNKWLSTRPLEKWYGIFTRRNRVTLVLLSYNNLKGVIPASIGNADTIIDLSLDHNYLYGSIPATIGNLKNIQQLKLSNNQLSGAIPATLGNLKEINTLDLSYNFLSKNIPSSLGKLQKLTYLYLNNNQLSGTIPSTLGKLQNLKYLELSHNNLSRSLSFKHNDFKNLIFLDLNNNQITGNIPASLYNISNLTYLYADSNKLTGNIPAQIGKSTTLRYLSFSSNQLTGNIPSQIGNLIIINSLHLDDNHLSDTIPSSIGNLKNLQELFLNNNQLSGNLPLSMMNFAKSTSINLANNKFTFVGLETLVHRYHSFIYAPQAQILIHQQNNTLSISAGGTLSNNTYYWYRAGSTDSTIIIGDSIFHPTQNGNYYAHVTNAIVTVPNVIGKDLILTTDTITYTTPLAQTQNSIANVAAVKTNTNHFSIYPNPAKDVIHIQINGTADIVLTNSAGKILLSKNINNSGVINVSDYADGVYYLQNKTSGETQKIIITH